VGSHLRSGTKGGLSKLNNNNAYDEGKALEGTISIGQHPQHRKPTRLNAPRAKNDTSGTCHPLKKPRCTRRGTRTANGKLTGVPQIHLGRQAAETQRTGLKAPYGHRKTRSSTTSGWSGTSGKSPSADHLNGRTATPNKQAT